MFIDFMCIIKGLFLSDQIAAKNREMDKDHGNYFHLKK